MKTKYGSVNIPHVPTSTNEIEDEDGEDLLDNSADSLTPTKRSILHVTIFPEIIRV